MLKAQHLTKYFQERPAVDDVSFEVAEGETFVLLGESGSGKTTTLKMLNHLIVPDGGSVSINGKKIDAQDGKLLRRGIGYVMQEAGLFPHYTIAENIGLVPHLLKWEATAVRKRVSELMELLGLPKGLGSRYPHELSGGQQQRVGIARALAADPPLILMDEPFGALDPLTRTDIQQEFRQLEALRSKTVVMVTHDVQEAFLLGDRIALMQQGKIVQQGRPQQLLYQPQHGYVKGFFDGQRLQLELLSVTLQELWGFLGETRAKTAASKVWAATAPVAQILSWLTHNEGQSGTIRLGEGQRHVDRDILMQAFWKANQVAKNT